MVNRSAHTAQLAGSCHVLVCAGQAYRLTWAFRFSMSSWRRLLAVEELRMSTLELGTPAAVAIAPRTLQKNMQL